MAYLGKTLEEMEADVERAHRRKDFESEIELKALLDKARHADLLAHISKVSEKTKNDLGKLIVFLFGVVLLMAFAMKRC